MWDIRHGVVCPYCGNTPEFVDSSAVYNTSYGMIYLCRPCRAWVGVHRGTRRALGCLANEELRAWKHCAHGCFDPIWREGPLNRMEAYEWLAREMDIERDRCHIGMFNVDECKEVINICKKTMSHDETHFACAARLNELGGKTPCCECSGHQCKTEVMPNGTEIRPVYLAGGQEIEVTTIASPDVLT